jgi:predicted MPP superfamily phosphohydrolase
MRRIEPAWVELTKVTLKLPHLPEAFSGLRLAQVSDFHLGGWMTGEHLDELLSLVMDQSPDLVALTGDYVLAQRHMFHIQEALDQLSASLKKLAGRFLTLGILGNHDYRYNGPAVKEVLVQAGVTFLANSVFSLERSGQRLHFAGVDDVYEGQDNLDAVLGVLPRGECSVLLVHEPDFADASAATGQFDLQISGHSHGGQVVLPFVGAPNLPVLGSKYWWGLYKVGNMLEYTNRGVGMTPPNIRLNCRPEITMFTLESA